MVEADPADAAGGESGAQFGPHRFDAGEGEGSARFRGARFDVADLRGTSFVDCDLSDARIRDGWLVGVRVSGYVSDLTINDIDVVDFVNAELDRRHPERVQLRAVETVSDLRAMWVTIERLWTDACERAGRLPTSARDESIDDEWSFVETLRHLIFITDAWACRTVLDDPAPYHPLGLTQRWYPAAEAARLGVDLAARPTYDEVLEVRRERMDMVGRVLDGLTDDDLGRLCLRSPAPGYPEEPRTVIECLSVVMEEEIEHLRFATRDLSCLEQRSD